jgi:hypothetical protein
LQRGGVHHYFLSIILVANLGLMVKSGDKTLCNADYYYLCVIFTDMVKKFAFIAVFTTR